MKNKELFSKTQHKHNHTMQNELDAMCTDLMKGLKAHKAKTGSDLWTSDQVVEVADTPAAETEGMASILDDFDDMIDQLCAGKPRQQDSTGDTTTTTIPQQQENLEDLVRLAMKQLNTHGIPAKEEEKTTPKNIIDAEEDITISKEDGGATINVSDDIAAQLDALGDLL